MVLYEVLIAFNDLSDIKWWHVSSSAGLLLIQYSILLIQYSIRIEYICKYTSQRCTSTHTRTNTRVFLYTTFCIHGTLVQYTP